MKRIAIIILLCSGLANAQNIKNSVIVSENSETITTSTQIKENKEVKTAFKKPEHYRETSKVAFYETLLSQNNFDIELKNDNKVSFYEALLSKNDFDIQLKDSNEKVAIKNTEEMVKKLKNRTMVASN